MASTEASHMRELVRRVCSEEISNQQRRSLSAVDEQLAALSAKVESLEKSLDTSYLL